MADYPPIREPIVDARTKLVPRAWALWFQKINDALSTAGIWPGTPAAAVDPTDPLQSLDAGVLLGRGTGSAGAPEPITVGTGLEMVGTTLTADVRERRYEPLTNGIVATPELIFANGDVLMVEVFD